MPLISMCTCSLFVICIVNLFRRSENLTAECKYLFGDLRKLLDSKEEVSGGQGRGGARQNCVWSNILEEFNFGEFDDFSTIQQN